MYCLKIDIPKEICKIDDELKAIYHSRIQFAYGYLTQEMIEIILWIKPKEW